MSKILYGKTASGVTIVIGQKESSSIAKIYIDGKKQIAPNEFRFTLNMFGNINPTQLSDYQQGIKNLFGMK